MSAELDAQSRPPPRWFFLHEAWTAARPRLVDEDREHLLRVLRVRTGERLIATDGRGRSVELSVEHASRHELGLALVAERPPEREPGERGSALPWIELALPLPRAARAEELVDRAVQLGAMALTPIATERTQSGRSDLTEARRARLERIAREAAKQSRRAWSLSIGDEVELDAWLDARGRAAIAAPDPRAARPLGTWVRALERGGFGTRDAPLALLFGPEGGFSARELATFAARGIELVTLGPHVMRIETAAEAALAIAAHASSAAAETAG